MDSLRRIALILALFGIHLLFPGCSNHPLKPAAVRFHTETLNRVDDHGDNWCITWTQFFYTDYWTVDDENNRTYQPKLSPKWISQDGTRMVFIWSDAMKNEAGKSHTTNYRWNQMEITLELAQ